MGHHPSREEKETGPGNSVQKMDVTSLPCQHITKIIKNRYEFE